MLAAMVAAVALVCGVLVAPERAVAVPTTQAGTATTAEPDVAPDAVSAETDARLSGHRVEVLADRTETTQVFINPDLTVTQETAAAPVRVRDASAKDGWRAVDLDLTKAADGSLRPDSPVTPVTFSGGDAADKGAQLATIDPSGPTALKVDWAGTLPTPTINGNTATYANVASNTDLVVTATRYGFEQSFVIKKEPTDPASFALPLTVDGTGLSVSDPSSAPTSGMNLEAAGKTVGAISPAVTWDAQTDPTSGQPANTTTSDMTLKAASGSDQLTISPDATFLADPTTKYPVTVDPSFSVSGGSSISDTYVRSDYPTTNYDGSTELDVGTYNSGTSKARSYIRFSGTNINGTLVTSATLKLYEFHSYSCTASEMDVYATSGASNMTTATWNSGQPSLVTSTKSSVTTAKGYSSSCAAGWVSVDATSAAQYIADQNLSVYAIGLRASESDSNSWKRFDSSDGTNSPVLSVNYDHYPDRVDYNNVTLPQATTYGGVRYVPTTKPTVSASFTDPDGQSAKLAFEVWNGPDSTTATRVATCTSSAVAPNATGSCTIGTALSDNTTYYVRAQAQSTYQGMNSAWSYLNHGGFAIAVSTPPAPSISCPYGNGSWTTNAPNGAVSCTVTVPGGGGNSGAVQAVIAVDGGSPTTPTFNLGAGGSVNVSVPNSGGTHSISARTYSATGATQGSPTTYSFGYGSAGFTGPAAGTTTTDLVRLSAASAPRGGSTVSAALSWRPAGTSAWQDGGSVPATAIQQGNLGSEPVTVNNYAWSTKQNVTGVGTDPRKPTLIELRLCFSYSGSSTVFCTTDNGAKPLTILRVPHAFGSGFPTATAGEGQVALWTGELALNTTDVDIKTPTGSLTVSRSHATFGQASTSTGGVFGTGFDGSFSDGSSATALEMLDSTGIDGTVSLIDSGGDSLVFREAGNGIDEMPTGTYTAADPFTATSGSTLSVADVAGVRQISLTGLDGSKSVWAQQSAGSTSWVPVSSQGAESDSTTTYTTSNGQVTQILAPVPNGVTCTDSPMPAGCNALDIHYDGSNTHVTSIDYEAWNQATDARVTTRVATYAYDGSGRLSTVTNQLGLVTTYHWDGSSYPGNTVLTQVDHTGLASWYYTYDSTNGKLRLKNVKRDGATTSDPQTTQTAYVYDIPTTTAGLPDLSSGTIAGWGQTDAPATAAAVFGADHPVGSVNASDLSTADWPYADLYYSDAEGYEVDSDNYGAGQWLTTAYFYANGQLDSTLQPSDTKAAAASGRTMDGRTITRYNADSTTGALIPAGTFPLDTWGPVMNAVVNGALRTVRTHTRYTYDEGAPNGDINPATGQNYDLVTTTTVGYSDPDNYSTDPGATLSADISTVSTTQTGYDAITAGTVTSALGWTLGQPTSVTTVMPNASDNIVHKTLYDADGNVIATENPGSTGADAGTTRTTYYTADANSDDADCGSKPAWAGQVCLVTPAAQPESGSLVTTPIASTRTNGYDYWLDPTTVTKTSGTGTDQATQTTTYNYMLSDGRTDLSDGRLNTTSETTSGLPDSTNVPTTQVLYDPTTLTQVGLASLDGTGATTSSVKSTFDLWGRTTRYVDANGAATTTSYVPSGTAGAGSVRTVTNAPDSSAVSSTYTYDGTDVAGATEHRGLPTQVTVDGLGTYQAAYDANGNLTTETMPGNVTQTRNYDSINRVVGLTYNSSAGQIVNYSRQFNGAGQVDDQGDTNGRATSFGYDPAGRLTSVADTTPGASAGTSTCTTRSYAFDPRGDRSALTAATGASCGTSGSATTTWAYDSYSRQASGANSNGTYSYDAFGRQTAIPAADAPARNNAGTSLTYYDTDAIHSITQGTTTTTYALDPNGRRLTETTGSTVVANDYANDADAPAWSTTGTGNQTTTTRYLSDLAGGLAATVATGSAPATTLQLQDLSGNTTEVVPIVQGAADVSDVVASQYDEYGNAMTGEGSRYGWHGSAQRAVTDSGFLLMGDRLYDAYTGRFTSTDPITGGNENSYNYPNDPIDLADLTGLSLQPLGAEGEIGFETAPEPYKMNGARSVRAGQEGEARVRANHDIGARETYKGESGKRRISDGSNKRAVSEVKNVTRQGLTRQIRDGIEFAERTGRQYRLFTRAGADISGPLQAEIDANRIVHHVF